MKLFVAAIIKDELSGLLEWIAYHKVIGVDGFIIADNGSTDGSRILLEQLEALGMVEVFDFPNPADRKPQLPAYQVCLERSRGRADVVAFIDADEFLLPTSTDVSIKEVLQPLFLDDDISAVALNWANFGSNGKLFYDDELVIERFTHRAPQQFHANHNLKSIVRPERITHFYNPHQGAVTHGRYVDINGNVLRLHERHGHGVSEKVCWDKLRVNHYVVKSLEEFITEKYRRGSAATVNRIKHKSYFQVHDRNDESCTLAATLAPMVKAEMMKLSEQLATLSAVDKPSQESWLSASFKKWVK